MATSPALPSARSSSSARGMTPSPSQTSSRQRPARCRRTCSGTPRVTSTAGMPGILTALQQGAEHRDPAQQAEGATLVGVAGGLPGGLGEADPVGAAEGQEPGLVLGGAVGGQ